MSFYLGERFMPCDYLSLPHEGIRTIAPYIPGKSVETLAQEKGLKDIIKLASNENPLGCSSLVLETLAELSSKSIASYPISSQHPLHQKNRLLASSRRTVQYYAIAGLNLSKPVKSNISR